MQQFSGENRRNSLLVLFRHGRDSVITPPTVTCKGPRVPTVFWCGLAFAGFFMLCYVTSSMRASSASSAALRPVPHTVQ